MRCLLATCAALFTQAVNGEESKINPITETGYREQVSLFVAALLATSGSVHAAHIAELEYLSSGSPSINLIDGPDPNSVAPSHFLSFSSVYGDSNGVFGVRLSTLNFGGSEGNARYSRTETFHSLERRKFPTLHSPTLNQR